MCSIDAVSIHTPIQGVTLIASSSICSMLSFNPHTHTGCDARLSAFPFLRVCFNPHTHTGCDPFLLSWYVARKSFNPHTHTGCDSSAPGRLPSPPCFNPHTHTGCDRKCYDKETVYIRVSIHTPIQGVTWVTGLPADMIDVSIHSPIQGVTGSFSTSSTANLVSIHTPIQGVTKPHFFLALPKKFQSTHPYRV